HAVSFRGDSGNWTLSWDTTVGYGQGWRLSRPDCRLIAIANGGCGYSPNIDDGDLNYLQKATFTEALTGVTERSLNYRDKAGVFVRGSGLYDFKVMDNNTAHVPLTHDAKGVIGSYTRLLDAFGFYRFTLGGMPSELRLGRQVVDWGESTFIPGGLNAVDYFDVTALQVPGAELRQALLPDEMAVLNLQLSKNLSSQLLYLLDWHKDIIEPDGAYFGTSDVAGPGGNRVILGFGAISDYGVDSSSRGGPAVRGGGRDRRGGRPATCRRAGREPERGDSPAVRHHRRQHLACGRRCCQPGCQYRDDRVQQDRGDLRGIPARHQDAGLVLQHPDPEDWHGTAGRGCIPPRRAAATRRCRAHLRLADALRVGAAMPAARPSDQRRGQLYARAARGLDADHEKQSVRRFRCRTSHPRLGAEEHLASRCHGHAGLRQCSQGFPGGAARRSRRGLRAGSRGQVERRPRGPWSALRWAGYEPQRQSAARRLPRVSQPGRARFRVRHQVRLGLRDLRAARVRRRDRRLEPAPALHLDPGRERKLPRSRRSFCQRPVREHRGTHGQRPPQVGSRRLVHQLRGCGPVQPAQRS